jgi:hypothetical protein
MERGQRFLKQFRQRMTQTISPRKRTEQIRKISYEHKPQPRRSIGI